MVIPILSFTKQEDLDKITTMVNNLFVSGVSALSQNISDYWIDQVVMKVDALSNEVFGKEKKELRQLVNKAKQLSKSRNLLAGGSFDNLSAWHLGRKVTTIEDGTLFKGEHLLLPPPSLYPSYAYQKVDESKLKPNTRYTVSGFVAQGDSLEILVSRYGKEIEQTLHVPYEEAHPVTSEPTPNCCVPRSSSPSCNGDAVDSHFFQYTIDVGSLQTEANLGIEFGLRIGDPTGFAKVGNMEIREERPLTASEIRKVQKVEQKWKQQFEQDHADVTAQIQPILNQINALYQNEDWNGALRPDVTYQDVQAITLPVLPKQRHWWMEDRAGEHYRITQQFQQALDRAFAQLEEHNLIHNGNFMRPFGDDDSWTPHGAALILPADDTNPAALHLSHWDASVTQAIEITEFDENKEYMLRVVGKGKGTITLQHGNDGESMETMHFSQRQFAAQTASFLTFDTPSFEVYIVSEDGNFIVDSIELKEMSPEVE